MSLDASAMVAILLHEVEPHRLLDDLEQTERCQTWVPAVFEIMLAIGRETGNRGEALAIVRKFLDLVPVSIEPIDRQLLPALSDAHIRYGKGSRHPERLNLGDCFSYARSLGTKLLYKGDDVGRTDMA